MHWICYNTGYERNEVLRGKRMIPNIFVSSTVTDLQHLRETIRESIEEMACNPVMNEYGEVGYVPSTSAEEACYLTVGNCDLCVLIISKRYGSIGKNGLGVTHNEFHEAREKRVPVICLVDSEVMVFKRVFDSNKEKGNEFPGMDAPENTFSLIQEITDYPVNNGIVEYKSASDARVLLKKQLAHIFGELLRVKMNPVKEGIRDVISEVKALRHQIEEKSTAEETVQFLKATRFILSDENDWYRAAVVGIFGDIDTAVPVLLKCRSFEDAVKESDYELVVEEDNAKMGRPLDPRELSSMGGFLPGPGFLPAETTFISVRSDRKLMVGQLAKTHLDQRHKELLRLLT